LLKPAVRVGQGRPGEGNFNLETARTVDGCLASKPWPVTLIIAPK